LCTLEGYAMYPAGQCDKFALSKLFVSTCQRSNPLLKNKPLEDLMFLGSKLLDKAAHNQASVVFFQGDEPVAMSLVWDVSTGSIYGDDEPPPSLRVHSLVGAALANSIPVTVEPGKIFFLGYIGVAPKHPTWLFSTLSICSVKVLERLGVQTVYSYSVNSVLVKLMAAKAEEQDPGWRDWSVKLADTVDAGCPELSAVPTASALCVLSSMPSMVDFFSKWLKNSVEDVQPFHQAILEATIASLERTRTQSMKGSRHRSRFTQKSYPDGFEQQWNIPSSAL